jgi:regulator of RNase E activity RraA
MDRCELPRGGLIGIRPLEPARPAAGLAFTVWLRPKDEARAMEGSYLDRIEPGQFVVLAAGGRIDCSVWGGNRSLAAIRNGAAGAVADGAYRDVEEHRQLGFPVYGLAPTPMAGSRYLITYQIDVPVRVCGVVLHPRDLVVADASGVVAVPRSEIGRVIDIAEQIAAAEAAVFGREQVTARPGHATG